MGTYTLSDQAREIIGETKKIFDEGQIIAVDANESQTKHAAYDMMQVSGGMLTSISGVKDSEDLDNLSNDIAMFIQHKLRSAEEKGEHIEWKSWVDVWQTFSEWSNLKINLEQVQEVDQVQENNNRKHDSKRQPDSKKEKYLMNILEDFLHKVEQESNDWKKTWEPVRLPGNMLQIPHNAETGFPYRGANMRRMFYDWAMTGYRDPRYLTTNTARKVFIKEHIRLLYKAREEAKSLDLDVQSDKKLPPKVNKANVNTAFIEKLMEEVSAYVDQAEKTQKNTAGLQNILDEMRSLGTDGYFVKKNTYAVPIYVPVKSVKVEIESEVEKSASAQEIAKEVERMAKEKDKGSQKTEDENSFVKKVKRKEKRAQRYRISHVFHVSKFKNLPEIYRPLDDNRKLYGVSFMREQDLAIVEKLIDRLDELDFKINVGGSDKAAYYIPSKKEINIPVFSSFTNVNNLTYVLAHEAIHAMKDVIGGREFESTLLDYMQQNNIPEDYYLDFEYALEEIVAEFGSMQVGMLLNIDMSHSKDEEHKNAFAYMKHFLEQAKQIGLKLDDDGKALLIQVLKDVESSVDAFISHDLLKEIHNLRQEQITLLDNEKQVQVSLPETRQAVQTIEKINEVIASTLEDEESSEASAEEHQETSIKEIPEKVLEDIDNKKLEDTNNKHSPSPSFEEKFNIKF